MFRNLIGSIVPLVIRRLTAIPTADHTLGRWADRQRALLCRTVALVFYSRHYWEDLDQERDNPREWQLLEL